MEDLEEIARLYRQLLLAVASSYPRESKHNIALRYIKEREAKETKDRLAKTVNKNKPPKWKLKLKQIVLKGK